MPTLPCAPSRRQFLASLAAPAILPAMEPDAQTEPGVLPYPLLCDPPADYQVLIAEQDIDDPAVAHLYPAGCDTDDLNEARTWAKAFNDRELVEPVGAWAVVRRNPRTTLPVKSTL